MLRCSAVSRIRLAPWVQLSALSTTCGHSCLRCTRNVDVALRRGPSYRCALMAATHHHHHQQQRTISTRSAKTAEEESVDGPSPANDHDNNNNNNEHSSHAVQLLRIVHDAVPLSRTEDILRMVKDCKNAKELHHVLLHEAYRHHLCWDLLNGHGYRVALIQAVTSVAPRLSAMEAWYDCMYRCRQMGFLMTRSFAAEGLAILRQWLMSTFQNDGRHPRLVTEGIAHLRELLHWCRCDCLVLDYVLYTRIVFLLTMMVSFFDRQNLYRSTFQPDFVKRDGVVVEWIMANERCVDYDECVLQCDAFLEEMLQRMREDLPSRPTFSFTYRLIDYFFAADNVDKMIAVMEDAQSYGTAIAESSTAKLMQLACAFNYINVPEMFLRWRVALPQCVMATPDMSRLLFFYARAGGGLPCPLCGEAFNHRNVSVYQWMQTPPHQRSCPALRMARRQKGELEEHRQLPQTQDRSHVAFALWDLSVARSIEWGPVEWRGFLLCCIFSPRAMEARGLMQQHLAAERMDDFLRATNMRLLRHHAPEEAVKELKQWQEMRCKISPIVLQECLMAAANVRLDASTRFKDVLHVWGCVQQKDSYIMPFTRRFMERRASELHESWHSEEEQSLFRAIISMQPRHVSLLDMKDSASDFVIGSTKKNVYLDASLQAARAQRWASASS